MNTLEIKIIGKAGTGKTSIGKLIKNTLNGIGINCEFHDIEDPCGEIDFPLVRCLASIADKTTVNIEVVQTRSFEVNK